MPEQVVIHSSRVVQHMVAPGVFKPVVSITYSAENMPPRTVWVDEAKNTPQERARIIAADLKAARDFQPETLDLPESL